MTGTVHGAYKQLGGAVAAGQLVITVNTEGQVVRDPVGNVVFQGPQAVKLNKDGLVTLTLPASDDSTLEPSGFTYAIVEQLSHVARASYRIVEFQVTNGGTIELADLAATDEAALDPSYGANLNAVLAELDGRLSADEITASIAAQIGEIADTKRRLWQPGPAFDPPTVSVQHGAATFTAGRMNAGAVLRMVTSASMRAAIGTAGAFTLEAIVSLPVGAFSAFAGILIMGEFNRGVVVNGSTQAHYSPDDLPGSSSLYNNGDHHIAIVCTCSSDRATLLTQKVYVDGALQIAGATNVAAGAQATDGFYLGGSKDGANGMAATLKGVRLSRGARYTGAYTPPTDLTRTDVDANTLALLPLDTSTAPYTGIYEARGDAAPGHAYWIGPVLPTDAVVLDGHGRTPYETWVEVA